MEIYVGCQGNFRWAVDNVPFITSLLQSVTIPEQPETSNPKPYTTALKALNPKTLPEKLPTL